MKIFLTAAIASFFLVLLTGPLQVYGQETSNTSSPSPKPTRIERKVERIETVREKIASREAKLKERISTIRDKKKAAIVERSSTRLTRINEQKTQQVQKHLEKMNDILARLKKRVEEKGAGKDITEAQRAIAVAESKIAAAKEVATAQSAEIYTPTASDKTKLKEELRALQQDIKSDLETLNNSIKEAKQALQTAIEVSAKTLGQK